MDGRLRVLRKHPHSREQPLKSGKSMSGTADTLGYWDCVQNPVAVDAAAVWTSRMAIINFRVTVIFSCCCFQLGQFFEST